MFPLLYIVDKCSLGGEMQMEANIHFISKHYSGARQQESKSSFPAKSHNSAAGGKSTKAQHFGEFTDLYHATW